MPPGAPFYKNMGHGVADTHGHAIEINRAAYSMFDPSFPWLFTMAFVQMKRPLPLEVDENHMRQAYEYEFRNFHDDRIFNALLFRHPRWRTKKNLLEALLIIPELTLADIARLTDTDLAAVQMYENLFFNVRDRLNDLMYINEIVFPQTRMVEYRNNYFLTEDPGLLMLRAAYRYGLDAVLEIYGSKVNREELPLDVYAKKLKAQVLAEANHIAEAGGLNQANLPVMNQAFKLLLAAENADAPKTGTTDSQMGLTAVGLNPGESILATALQLNDHSQYNRMLKLQKDLGGDSTKN
jgi:hypothetical protein